MNITINVIFLLLSLSTLSSTATPINLDRVMTTELGARNVGNLVMDRPSIVKRGLPLDQMQPARQDEAMRLAWIAQNNFPFSFIRVANPTQNMQNFPQKVISLAEHLQSRVGDHALTKPIAESLRRVLADWREEVKSPMFCGAASEHVNHIVAKIATCRNIVEKALAVAPTSIRPLNDNFQRLEELLPVAHSVVVGADAIDVLEDLILHLQPPTSWDIEAKAFINAKLMTFRDWAQDLDNSMIAKSSILYRIKECEKIMHGESK